MPAAVTTIAEARTRLRDELVAAVEAASSAPASSFADRASMAAMLRDLASTYRTLGGDLELEPAGDPRDGLVDEALTALLEATADLTLEDFPPRLEHLAASLNDLAAAVKARAA